LAQTLATARLRTTLVVGLSLFFWFGLFCLFYEGFRFLVAHVGRPGASYHSQTVHFVFHLFFASLNVMLVLSAGIILYGGLFRSGETRFLLTTPARPERVVLHKFQEAVFFSSWGFFLLGSPMMIAYGIVDRAPWYYYLLLAPLMLTFIYIPCGLGGLACIVIVRLLPRVRKVVFGAAVAVIVIVGLRWGWATFGRVDQGIFQQQWFEETFERFRVTRVPWLPSSWLTAGLMEAARRPTETLGHAGLRESLKYLGVLAANALFLHVILLWVGGKTYRPAYCGLASRGDRPRRRGVAPVDRALLAVLGFLPTQVRTLLVKDFRVFRRDPVQWSQFLVFFGLLGLYFLNMDRFSQRDSDLSYRTWVNMVSFLNLVVVGLILSTFTTRFIYPMISLEGSRFWILGLLPLRRDTIIWSKFLFAAGGSWLPCGVLVLLSDLLLRVSPTVVLVHQFTCLLLCVGLASIAVGLGAAMPDLREDSPSKIAAGFGGTLNLVLSASYILAITLLTALPVHFYAMAVESGIGIAWLARYSLSFWLTVGLFGACVLAIIAIVFPLRKGLHAFRKMEF
jgi:ABC-2 type transport system permease protein